MKFSIHGEDLSVKDEVRKSIEEKLSFLSKYMVVDDGTSARVTVKKYNDDLKIEITIPSKVGLLRSEVVHNKLDSGIDLAIERIEDQIRRNKKRLSRRHKESLASSFVEENTEEIKPVKTKVVYADEMDLEEAIVQMEMLSHSFFVFKDSNTKDASIVYKRNDGQYGVLQVKI